MTSQLEIVHVFAKLWEVYVYIPSAARAWPLTVYAKRGRIGAFSNAIKQRYLYDIVELLYTDITFLIIPRFPIATLFYSSLNTFLPSSTSLALLCNIYALTSLKEYILINSTSSCVLRFVPISMYALLLKNFKNCSKHHMQHLRHFSRNKAIGCVFDLNL